MDILTTRKHEIIMFREAQLARNFAAIDGGRPYIDMRLWRAPNETDASWDGDPDRGIVGRRERTALVNDAGRVARKINQYLFRAKAVRTGADAAFLADCTKDHESVDAFMQKVNTALTGGRWCWLQVDRPALAEGGETLANKPPIKWILWDALDVPDWHFNEAGVLDWIIVRSHIYDNADPTRTPTAGTLFTLYHLVDGVVYVTEETSGGVIMPNLRKRVPLEGMTRLPFIPVGTPSVKAWWFDDVENLQAQILNLDSQHNETLTETVYPQLVLPAGIASSLEVRLNQAKINGKEVVSLIRELCLGRKIPVMETNEDKGITRYISPNGDMKLLTEEGTRKRALLFDIAGLALFNKESRQAQTAESKQFDQLDTNSTLKNRALILQDAEQKLVELSRLFDPSFAAYEPKYPCDFDVVDVAGLSDALMKLDNMPSAKKLPVVARFTLKATLRLLKEVSSGVISDDDISAALEAVDELTDEDLTADTAAALPDPFHALTDEDEDTAEDEDDEGTDDDTDNAPDIDEDAARRIFDQLLAKHKKGNKRGE